MSELEQIICGALFLSVIVTFALLKYWKCIRHGHKYSSHYTPFGSIRKCDNCGDYER